MNPLYPYTLTDALQGPLFYREAPIPPEAIKKEHAYLASQLENSSHVKLVSKVYSFVLQLAWDQTLYLTPKSVGKTKLSTSIALLPHEGGCTVFVLLCKALKEAVGAQGWRFKKYLMLKINKDFTIVKDSISPVVRLSKPMDERNPDIEDSRRRISIMQRLDGSPYVPTNFAYMLLPSKGGKKAAIFQELAICDLQVYDAKVEYLYNLSPVFITDIMKRVIGALALFADKKVLHRDLKPENILVFKNRDPAAKVTRIVKVSDFGHACDVNDWEARKMNPGSFSWASPECFVKGANPDASSAIWTLGIMLYYMSHKEMPAIQLSFQELERINPKAKEWNKICSESFAKYNEELKKLPLPPEKITSLKDLAIAMMQDRQKRISLQEIKNYFDAR